MTLRYALLFACSMILWRCGQDNQAHCKSPTASQLRTPLVSLDQQSLEIGRGCSEVYAADLSVLKNMARKATYSPIVSVMLKTSLPASNNRHDYFSLARYAWPDPNSPNGLPYINRDGEANPESDSDSYDKHNSDIMFNNIPLLSLAYFYTRESTYAERAALQIRTWFLDPETRMNPSIRYGSMQPGTNDGRASGVIEMARMHQILDAFALISDSEFQTDADRTAMSEWMSEYLTWLKSSEYGIKEFSTVNNHGTWYDVQRAAVGLYLGKDREVASFIDGAKQRRIDEQINANGDMPHELWRAQSFYYSCYAIRGLIELAEIGTKVGVNLWKYQSPDGGSLRKAIDRVARVLKREAVWEGNGAVDKTLLYDILHRAAIGLDDSTYADLKDEIGTTKGKRANVVLRWPNEQ